MKLNINNRRYIGNKTKLINFIDNCMAEEKIEFKSLGDVFSGTGVVAEYYLNKGKDVIVNDLLYSNYIIYKATLSNDSKYNLNKIEELLDKYNNMDSKKIEDNYFSNNVSGTYYHYLDAKKIGYIRGDIENKYYI